MKVLIIPDKFKGTLTASAAVAAIARGWRRSRPRDVIDLLPMSDGGDGFGEVMGKILRAKIQKVQTMDAAHRACEALWWWDAKTKTAVIESANVIGLAKLPAGEFHPFALDTFGLGAVIRAAAGKGARRCVIGIGGSATNDGGFGLARALGWSFWDDDDVAIEQWTGLHRLARISAPRRTRWFCELIVAVDVQNPLLGIRGATRVYGAQKGLRAGDFAAAEKCLRHFARKSGGEGKLSRNAASQPGAGAAGGLGFGLMTFLGAKPVSGFELFAEWARLDEHLREADLVITGEGQLDESSFMGKGVGELVRRCRVKKIPCLALSGDLDARAGLKKFFVAAHALSELTTVAKAKADPAGWLEQLAERSAKLKSLNSLRRGQ